MLNVGGRVSSLNTDSSTTTSKVKVSNLVMNKELSKIKSNSRSSIVNKPSDRE